MLHDVGHGPTALHGIMALLKLSTAALRGRTTKALLHSAHTFFENLSELIIVQLFGLSVLALRRLRPPELGLRYALPARV